MHHILLPLLLLFSNPLLAQELVEFENGKVADADDINANFDKLRQFRDPYNSSDYYQWHLPKIDVDCKNDSRALDRAFNQYLHLNRVNFEIVGPCELPTIKADGTGVNPTAISRAIKISGQCTKEGTNASLLEGVSSGMYANNGGMLYLKCVELVGSSGLSVFGPSYLRLDSVKAAEGDKLNLYSFDGGVIRIFNSPELLETGEFGPPPWTPELGAIRIDNGGTLRLGTNLNIQELNLKTGASLRVSANVEANINQLTMWMSNASVESKNANIGSADINVASTLLIRLDDGGNSQIDSVSINNASNLFEY